VNTRSPDTVGFTYPGYNIVRDTVRYFLRIDSLTVVLLCDLPYLRVTNFPVFALRYTERRPRAIVVPSCGLRLPTTGESGAVPHPRE
jgi:hypothetical protein